jgi:ElaB/YqjD/DUF883 family membrane-anchored ribosome-binding protein
MMQAISMGRCETSGGMLSAQRDYRRQSSVRKSFLRWVAGRKITGKEIPMNEVMPEKLIADVKVLIDDVEDFWKTTASETAERIVALRRRLEQKIAECRKALAEEERAWIQNAEQARVSAKGYPGKNTWTKFAVAVGIGLVLGLLLRRN